MTYKDHEFITWIKCKNKWMNQELMNYKAPWNNETQWTKSSRINAFECTMHQWPWTYEIESTIGLESMDLEWPNIIHIYGCLKKALDQMKPPACRHVDQINGFHDDIGYLMIDDAWYGGKEPPPNELGFQNQNSSQKGTQVPRLHD